MKLHVQLEDAEFSRTAALKSKQNLETELADVQGQLEDVLRIKSEMKEQVLRLTRERADLTTQLEDHEEELQVNICYIFSIKTSFVKLLNQKMQFIRILKVGLIPNPPIWYWKLAPGDQQLVGRWSIRFSNHLI